MYCNVVRKHANTELFPVCHKLYASGQQGKQLKAAVKKKDGERKTSAGVMEPFINSLDGHEDVKIKCVKAV